jgi:hypothetical protein
MKGPLGTFVAIVVSLLAVTPLARGEEQTRESYKAQVEPLCQANRQANERIMQGAQKRINKHEFEPVGKQFVRVSESFGGLIRRLAGVSAPPADEHRVDRWFEQMRLLKTRLRLVGRYYRERLEMKAAHEAVLAERAGITANNTSIVFHFHYCRFGRFERG